MPEKRPKVNMTPRSYWRSTRTDAFARISTNTTTMNGVTSPASDNIDSNLVIETLADSAVAYSRKSHRETGPLIVEIVTVTQFRAASNR